MKKLNIFALESQRKWHKKRPSAQFNTWELCWHGVGGVQWLIRHGCCLQGAYGLARETAIFKTVLYNSVGNALISVCMPWCRENKAESLKKVSNVGMHEMSSEE